MVLVKIRKYSVLLWGIFLLFSVESRDVITPEISSTNSSAEHLTPTETEVEHQSSPRHSETTFIPNNKVTVTQNPSQKHADMTTATKPKSSIPLSEENKAVSSTQSHTDTRGSTAGVLVKSTTEETMKMTVTNSVPQLDHISTVLPTMSAVPITGPSLHTLLNVSETKTPIEQPSSNQGSFTMSLSSSTTISALGLVSSLQRRSTIKPGITSFITPKSTMHPSSTLKVSYSMISTTTSGSSAIKSYNSRASTRGPVPTSDLGTTSQPVSVTEASTMNSALRSTPQPLFSFRTSVSSSKSTSTTRHSSTIESSSTTVAVSSTSGISTAISTKSSAGVLIPRVPKRLPILTTKSSPAHLTSPPKQSPPVPGIQPCFTNRNGVVNRCLIAIASLAGLTTIFMVSTIILCAKLSSRRHRYRIREAQQGTEMVCISALLPERNCVYGRNLKPKSNEVLLLSTEGDSDDDGGDNLTLNSFLPENDRLA
ncbi:P-selectin glycoprotein ligand 1 [Polymixia lowei]